MSIEQFLQQNAGDRLTHYGRWLYWDDFAKEWVVREQVYRARTSQCIYSGSDITEALKALGEGTP